MPLQIADLRERFERSDGATAASSGDGVEVVGKWADESALEGELEALEVFCFDGLCPILTQVSVDADSSCLWCGSGSRHVGEGEEGL